MGVTLKIQKLTLLQINTNKQRAKQNADLRQDPHWENYHPRG